LALAQKVIQRARGAGVPVDLIPDEITSISVLTDGDAESLLRTAVLEFVDRVRAVERSIAASRRGDSVPEELDVSSLGTVSEAEWREHWPADAVDDVEREEPEGPVDIDDAGETEQDDAEADNETETETNGDAERAYAEQAADELAKVSKESGKGSKRGRGRS
jgi:XTP/dITP diphosphohydrolase